MEEKKTSAWRLKYAIKLIYYMFLLTGARVDS